MSQFELIEAWLGHSEFLLSVFVAFISATSAYLIVANLKGQELHRNIFVLVTSLYVLASLFFILFYAKVTESMLNLRGQMHEAGLTWYTVVYEPQFIFPSIVSIGGLLMICLVVGSIWYFFTLRKTIETRIT